MKKFALIAMISLLLLSVSFSLVESAETWKTQIVDNSERDLNGRSQFNTYTIALDPQGNPHICYTHTPYQRPTSLNYASLDGGKWTIQEIIGGSYGEGNIFSSFAMDSSGKPHIAFCNSWGLRYANLNSSGWDIQTVDSGPSFGKICSLALDSNGKPHICYSYLEDQTVELKYASLTDHWNVQTVIATGTDYVNPSLALDGSNNPHVAFFKGDNYSGVDDLMYASWNGEAWNIEVVEENITHVDSIQYARVSLAVKSAEKPYLCYTYFYDYYSANYKTDLKFAYLSNSTWNTQTLQKNSAGNSQIILDQAGKPHLIYGSNSEVKYGVWNGSGWDMQTASPVIGNLAVESNGNVHTCYVADQTLMYGFLGSSSTDNLTVYVLTLGIAAVVLIAVAGIFYKKRNKPKKIKKF
jgi:hypothetical protein